MKKTLKIFAVFAILGFALAGVATAADSPAAPAEEKPDWGMNVGDKIKPITLKVVANGSGEVNSRKLPKDTLFMIASSVCSQCRNEMREVAEVAAAELSNLDIYVIMVDMNVEAGAKRIGDQTKFPIISDPEYQFGQAVEMTAAPSSFIIGKDGKILMKEAGYKKNGWKKFKLK